MRELGEAIEAAAWPRALILALDAWRGSRSPALADLIDLLAARCPRARTRVDLHPQWVRAALAPYNPVRACALFDHVHAYLARGPAWAEMQRRLGDDPIVAHLVIDGELPKRERNRIERLCALARWPTDPRVATVLATWFERDFAWPPPFERGPIAVLAILAEQLIRIGDPRVLPRIAACLERPRARTDEARAAQQALARRVVDGIRAQPDDPAVVAWVRALAPPPPTVDEQALWDAIARDPDDLAPRLVLADFLIERGDPRGEQLARACAGQGIELANHWHDWFGDLALVISRHRCRFDRGMIAGAMFGLRGTPSWAYAAIAHHRELAAIKTWSVDRRADMPAFAAMIAQRASLDTLQITAADLPVLAAARPQWKVRALELVLDQAVATTRACLVQILQMFPTLEVLELLGPSPPDLPAALPLLASAPALRRVRVFGYGAGREQLQAVATRYPYVEVR